MAVKYVGIDLSQIEMRIATHVSEDPELVRIFWAGEDIHTSTACRMFGLPPDKIDGKKHRYPAKRTGFGVLYGISAAGLLNVFFHDGVTNFTERDCQRFIDSWFDTYTGVKHWIDSTEAFIRRNGYVVDMFGRRRWIPEVYSTLPYVVDAGLRQGVNTPIQSGAQGYIKEVMKQSLPYRQAWKRIGVRCDLVMQVHDELIYEMDEEWIPYIVPIFKQVMETAVPLIVPVKADVEIGTTWGNMKEVSEEELWKLRVI